MLPPAHEFTMLFLDPPDHTRLRALVNKAFARRAVNALEPRIRAILGSLLDAIEDPAGFDFMQAVARPVPVMVIAEMLGVPPRDRDRFGVWSARRARLLEPVLGRREREAGKAAAGEFDAYFRPLIAQRRAAPRDDIVSALALVQDEGERLSERETLNMLRLLLIGGHETTTNLIGGADLQGLLTRALPRFGAQGAGGSMIVRRAGPLLPLVLHVNPVGLQETDIGGWPVAALVLVVDPVSGTGIDAGVAAAALDLTEMESRVAALLTQSMSVGEIAAATGRKESTIRSHVKHMFTKLGLSRQAELVRLVQSLAGSPRPRR